MLRSLAVFFSVALCVAQQSPSPKEFFQRAPGSGVQPTYEELLAVVDQIPKLSKQDIQELLPSVLKSVAFNGESGMQGALALFAIARRSDSAELLTPHLAPIAALLLNPDKRLKATATSVFLAMKPPPAAAVAPLLVSFILGPGEANGKTDAAFALVKMAPSTPETEQAIVSLLGLASDAKTEAEALNAAADPKVTDKVIDAIGLKLSSPNEDVRIAAILSIRRIGTRAVSRTSRALSGLVADTNQSATVKRLAGQTLSSETDNCRTLVRCEGK